MRTLESCNQVCARRVQHDFRALFRIVCNLWNNPHCPVLTLAGDSSWQNRRKASIGRKRKIVFNHVDVLGAMQFIFTNVSDICQIGIRHSRKYTCTLSRAKVAIA